MRILPTNSKTIVESALIWDLKTNYCQTGGSSSCPCSWRRCPTLVEDNPSRCRPDAEPRPEPGFLKNN